MAGVTIRIMSVAIVSKRVGIVRAVAASSWSRVALLCRFVSLSCSALWLRIALSLRSLALSFQRRWLAVPLRWTSALFVRCAALADSLRKCVARLAF